MLALRPFKQQWTTAITSNHLNISHIHAYIERVRSHQNRRKEEEEEEETNVQVLFRFALLSYLLVVHFRLQQQQLGIMDVC